MEFWIGIFDAVNPIALANYLESLNPAQRAAVLQKTDR